MPNAAVHIGSDGVGALVAKPDGEWLAPVLERRVPLRPPLSDAGAVFAIAAAEVARCREAGAEAVEVLVSSALGGSHLLRALRRRFDSSGLPAPQLLSAAEEAELTYRGAVQVAGCAAPAAVATLADSLAVAVGGDPRRPQWWATRSVSPRELTRAAARSDPPTAAQVSAMAAGASRSIATLHPPARFERGGSTVLAGPYAGVLGLLLGERTVEWSDIEPARERLTFAHSEILAAQLGIGLGLARELAAAVEIVAAIGDRLGLPITISHGGLLEGAIAGAGGERRFLPAAGSQSAGAVARVDRPG